MRQAICASDPFCEVWGGLVVPEHRNPDKWGTQEHFNTPMHPPGVPERSATFLAVKTRFEGGRYKTGHFDDLVTGEDRTSAAIREEKKANFRDRENERDKTCGIRTVQGTCYHGDDAYTEIGGQRSVIGFALPCFAAGASGFCATCCTGVLTGGRSAYESGSCSRPGGFLA